MPLTVVSECLNGCSGCEISLLNAGGDTLDFLTELDIVHMPLLMDHKYYGQAGERNRPEIPRADVGIVSGGIRNREHLEVAEEMRKGSGIIVALGTCATHGGIPALINQFSNEDLLARYYQTTETTDAGEPPTEGVPPLLDRAYALDEKIEVDVYLPGCPPHPDMIRDVVDTLLKGDLPVQAGKSVCDSCPTRREGKGKVRRLERFTRNLEYGPDTPLKEMACLLESGILCMGPVTRQGCAGMHGGFPRCLVARVPCRGCFGPVKQNGNQLLDLLNALASNGMDIRNIPDRSSLLRFSGAHRRLICSNPGRTRQKV